MFIYILLCSRSKVKLYLKNQLTTILWYSNLGVKGKSYRMNFTDLFYLSCHSRDLNPKVTRSFVGCVALGFPGDGR